SPRFISRVSGSDSFLVVLFLLRLLPVDFELSPRAPDCLGIVHSWSGPGTNDNGAAPPDNQEVLPTTDDTDCRPSGTCMVSAPGCGAGRSLSAASMVTVAEAGRAQLGGGGARIVVERRHPPLQAGGDPTRSP